MAVEAAGGPARNILGEVVCPRCLRRVWVRFDTAMVDAALTVRFFDHDDHEIEVEVFRGRVFASIPWRQTCPFEG
jgi:uncharacterized protein (UPF0212 family)